MNTIDLVLPTTKNKELFTVDYDGTSITFEYDGFFADRVNKDYQKKVLLSVPREEIPDILRAQDAVRDDNLYDSNVNFGTLFIAQDNAMSAIVNKYLPELELLAQDVNKYNQLPEVAKPTVTEALVNKIINSGFGLN